MSPSSTSSSSGPDRPDMRPMGRTASRLFVVAAILSVVVISVVSVLMLRNYATDPEVQQQVDEARDMLQARADSAAAADSTSVSAPGDSALVPD